MRHEERNSMKHVEECERTIGVGRQDMAADKHEAEIQATGLALTPKAAEKIKAVFVEQKMPEGSCLRIGVKGGGCSGFSYVLDVTRDPAEGDEVFESNGVRIVADLKSYLYLSGTTIDYDDALLKGGFVFHNPNAKRSCGCGASFSA
jgi:iron-sulfur cluster assembly protein